MLFYRIRIESKLPKDLRWYRAPQSIAVDGNRLARREQIRTSRCRQYGHFGKLSQIEQGQRSASSYHRR